VELTYISQWGFHKLFECGLNYILIFVKYRVLCKINQPFRQSEPSLHDSTVEILLLMWLNREARIPSKLGIFIKRYERWLK
jgi:hypothetical protein